jgi:cytochrome c oxidase cbb3-type subunit I/II
VLPEFLGGIEYLTNGRLAPAGRSLLLNGWVITGLLGASMYAITHSTGVELKRKPLATAALLLLAVGTLASAFGIKFGLQTGVAGFEAPLWARAITVAGFVLATLSISGTARKSEAAMGATGWYLTAGAWWLALSGLVSLVPPMAGVGGSIQTAFAEAGIIGLFVIVTSVGLLYHAATTLTGTDPSAPRPLAAPGFWSLALVWGSMSATRLIFSAAPDWYETLGVAMAIAAFVPLLAIATDLGLMLKGSVEQIGDRATLRYGVVAIVSLAAATAANLLITYRSTSAIVHGTTVTTGRDLLIMGGVASFALFASQTMMRGGRAIGSSAHFTWSVAGLIGIAIGTIAGGVVVGFSWAAGPAKDLYANRGAAWEITAVSSEPFLWITAVSLVLFLVAQVVYLGRLLSRPSAESLPAGSGALEYDLQFEGGVAAPTSARLTTGIVVIFLFALLFTGLFPAMDPANSESTLLGDTFREYPSGSPEAAGRNVYITEGCAECHTQSVRPVGTDVGLGPVSQPGDYVHENPALLGNVRFGPDLMHVASSEDFDPQAVAAHLRDPQATFSWSTMPAYDYLSSEDIDALVVYIETLR